MAAAQGQQQQGDNSYAILWVIAIIFVISGATWYFAQAQIVAFIFKLRLFEINFIKLFTSGLDQTAAAIQQIAPARYKQVPFDYLAKISAQVGNYLAYPVGLILSSLAVITYLNHTTLKYRKTYSMQKLVTQEVSDWPQITPVANVNLVKVHVDKGPWAMGLTPMQFAKKYDLLIEEHTVTGHTDNFDFSPKVTATLARGEAHRVFSLQLGPYWQGVEKLPVYVQALFAVFAARAAGDRTGAAALLGQIAASTHTGKLDFTGTKELLKKHINNKHVVNLMSRHAFVLTVLASMLELARQDGVLPSAEFLWLKPIDRRLWFMLNTVGRKTPFAEVAGPYAHWLVEKQYGRPIKTPMVEEAVNALDLAIKESVYIPDEEEG